MPEISKNSIRTRANNKSAIKIDKFHKNERGVGVRAVDRLVATQNQKQIERKRKNGKISGKRWNIDNIKQEHTMRNPPNIIEA